LFDFREIRVEIYDTAGQEEYNCLPEAMNPHRKSTRKSNLEFLPSKEEYLQDGDAS